jgi:hypothetical protein
MSASAACRSTTKSREPRALCRVIIPGTRRVLTGRNRDDERRRFCCFSRRQQRIGTRGVSPVPGACPFSAFRLQPRRLLRERRNQSGPINGNARRGRCQHRTCRLPGSLQTQAHGITQCDRDIIGLGGLAKGVGVRRPASKHDPSLWQAAAQATNGIAQMSWAAGVEIRDTYHRDALRFEMKDAGAGDRLDSFDAGVQPMLVQNLSQHYGDGFVEWTAAGDAEDGCFGLPLRRQFVSRRRQSEDAAANQKGAA